MKVTIVRGLPGSGKSHEIKRNYPGHTVIDMADLRDEVLSARDSYDVYLESMRLLFSRLLSLQDTEEEVVVEGIFHPGSSSSNWLQSFLTGEDIDYSIIQVWRPFEQVISSLVKDYEKDGDKERFVARVYLASKYEGGFK
jgi:hypothetical protein